MELKALTGFEFWTGLDGTRDLDVTEVETGLEVRED